MKKDKFIEYYPNGMKWREVTFKDGKEDGFWTQWYENGQKRKGVTFKDGRKDGLCTYWYKSGQKSGEKNYKDGELDGSFTKWYKNGEKKSERTYKDGKRVSERIWNKDGSLWNIDDELASNSLGWLNLPEQSKLVSKTSISFTSSLFDKYEIVCLVGMGGSILGAKAIIDFVVRDMSKIFIMGDSTLPGSVDMIRKIVKGRKAMFVIASKSGTTLETIMIYEHLKKIASVDCNDSVFISITDPDTYLDQRAFEPNFKQLGKLSTHEHSKLSKHERDTRSDYNFIKCWRMTLAIYSFR